MEQEDRPHNVGYIFALMRDANKNGDDVIIGEFSDKSISFRIEFQKKGIFTFEDKKEQP